VAGLVTVADSGSWSK